MTGLVVRCAAFFGMGAVLGGMVLGATSAILPSPQWQICPGGCVCCFPGAYLKSHYE